MIKEWLAKKFNSLFESLMSLRNELVMKNLNTGLTFWESLQFNFYDFILDILTELYNRIFR